MTEEQRCEQLARRHHTAVRRSTPCVTKLLFVTFNAPFKSTGRLLNRQCSPLCMVHAINANKRDGVLRFRRRENTFSR